MEYYLVDDTEKFDAADKVAEYIAENMEDDYFDKYLNEIEPECSVAGYTFDTAYALRELDPRAYDYEKYNYYDFLQSNEIQPAIEKLWSDGDEVDLYGFNVVYHEEDDEDEEDVNE